MIMKRLLCKNHTFGAIVLTVVLAFLLASCVSMVETKKKYNNSGKYTDLKPVTVNELRSIIREDTERYKIILFWEPYHNIDIDLYQSLCSVIGKDPRFQLIAVLDDCGGLKYAADNLKRAGIPVSEAPLYIRDDSEPYRSLRLMSKGNPDRQKNIVTALFDNADDYNGDYLLGFYIADPKGNLKKVRYTYSKDNIQTEAIGSLQPSELNSYDRAHAIFTSDVVDEILALDYRKTATRSVSGRDITRAISNPSNLTKKERKALYKSAY